MRVFILEDDCHQKVRLKGLIHEVCATSDYPLSQVQTFSKPQILMHYVPESAERHVYFLEVNLNGDIHHGYETAAKIREKNPRAIIVLIASDTRFSELSFSYHIAALDYLDKTNEDERLLQELDDILRFALGYDLQTSYGQIA